MAFDTTTINSELSANQRDLANKTSVVAAQVKAQEAVLANEATVLGNNVQQTVNGFKSLDNTILDATDTKSALTRITQDASVLPSADPNSFIVGVEGGTSTVTELTTSLTGIVPPDESISIVALGGSAINELTASVTVATERKSSLLDQINTVAADASVEGLSSEFTQSVTDMKNELNAAANSSTLTQDVMGAVSAVENLGNEIANEAANAIGGAVNAISQTVNQVTRSINDGFQSVLNEVETSVSNLINNVLPETDFGTGFIQNLFEDLTGEVTSVFQNALGATFGLPPNIVSSIVQDVLNGGDVNFAIATKKLLRQDESLSPRMQDIIRTTPDATSPKQFEQVVIQKANSLNVPVEEINTFRERSRTVETALSQVETTISGKIVSEVGDFYTEDTDLAELVKRYLRSDTTEFPYVDSKEELGLEFYKMNRTISEMIIHASETHTNANIGAEEIHLRHNENGHNGIQYHYVIRRDGRLQRGMPLDVTSEATNILGHAPNCIDVVLVGGVNVPTEADNPLDNLSSQSFTQIQMKTLEALMETFYRYFPGGQILGHNAIDANVEDPYFDVIAFVENKFGKKSVYTDPLTETSLSASELVNKRPV